jgi:DHA1 family bicyclomycin/chloramphenicol resistance-like MFS transporter
MAASTARHKGEGVTGKHGGARYWKLAALLAVLSMLSPFSIDTFFPSFHAISTDFGLSKWAVQQTLTVYMLPLSMMSLVQGPLSDAVGRRPVILAGISVYTLASLGCTFAPNFATLLAFRAMQGLSAGVGVIVGRAVIRDLFEGPQAQKLMSLVTMLFAFAPSVAPVIGGWIHVTLGWHAVFGFMALFGTSLGVATYVLLPETHPKEKRPHLHVAGLARTAWTVARHREFLLLAVGAGANFASLMVFIGAAPAVVVDHWHLSETQFANLFVPVIAGLIGSALILNHMAGRFTYVQQARLGLTLVLSGSAIMAVLEVVVTSLPIIVQQAVIFVIAFGAQLVGPTLNLRMLDLFPLARGSAASVQSCVAIAISALVFGVIAPALSGSMATLAAGSFVSALVAFGLWSLSQRHLRLQVA